MSMVLNTIEVQSGQRPSYTKYELAKLVKEKRCKESMSREEFADKYDISISLLESIENASRSFNVPMYKACSIILSKSIDELTAIDYDNDSNDYRTNQISEEVQKTVNIANNIFNEIVAQYKLGVH